MKITIELYQLTRELRHLLIVTILLLKVFLRLEKTLKK